MDGMTDADIVRATLQDKEHFAVLVTRYEDRLRRYVRRLGVRNQEDQDDLLQDIFVKVYRNLNAYDQTLSFSSWVYRIAHNEAVSLFRRKSARPEGSQVDDGDEIVQTLAANDDVLRDAVARHEGYELMQAIERLDERYRDVIVLRYFEGKEYEEIADILTLPVGSVATRIHRAKGRLRALLEPATA